MKLRNRIGLLFSIIFLLTSLTFMSKAEYNYINNQENLVPAQGSAYKEDTYYLTELNGYVAVYYSDKKSLYECTNIKVSELPSDVQNEIRTGKEISGITALYGFLENYSS